MTTQSRGLQQQRKGAPTKAGRYALGRFVQGLSPESRVGRMLRYQPAVLLYSFGDALALEEPPAVQ